MLRRYGLLVPIGLAFDWLLRHPAMFGVIEALGVTVVVGAGLAVAVGASVAAGPRRRNAGLGRAGRAAVTSNAGWWADEVVAGKFPATYLGFVLVGMAAVRTGRFADRRWGLTVAALAAGGGACSPAPDRYPGGLAFVVPGLAGTALYALAQCVWPTWLGAADRLIQSATAHTLGIFLAHCVVYYVLVDRAGVAGTVPGAVARRPSRCSRRRWPPAPRRRNPAVPPPQAAAIARAHRRGGRHIADSVGRWLAGTHARPGHPQRARGGRLRRSGRPADRRGVDGDRIVSVGSVDGRGRREIDADGLVLTPGFVDIHTHYDGHLGPGGVAVQLARRHDRGMGNCGVGFAPAHPDRTPG